MATTRWASALVNGGSTRTASRSPSISAVLEKSEPALLRSTSTLSGGLSCAAAGAANSASVATMAAVIPLIAPPSVERLHRPQLHAAVDHHVRAGDVAAGVARQQQGERLDLVGFGHAPDGH